MLHVIQFVSKRWHKSFLHYSFLKGVCYELTLEKKFLSSSKKDSAVNRTKLIVPSNAWINLAKIFVMDNSNKMILSRWFLSFA